MTALIDLDGSPSRSRVGTQAEGFGPEDLGTTDAAEGLSLSELLGEVFLPAASRDGSGPSDGEGEAA